MPLICFFRTEECLHCDRNAHCVGGHCICKHGFVGDGLDCWGKIEKSFDIKVAFSSYYKMNLIDYFRFDY